MNQMRLTLITIILFGLLIPVGLVQADETWIENFAITSDIVPGENVTVTVAVGYDFSSQVQLNPGIFSFKVDDWIVDAYYPATGSGTENYTLEFPVPVEDGDHVYQANVWYTKNDRWFFDGIQAAHNFTIHVGEETETTTEVYSHILEHSAPTRVNASTSIDVFAKIEYSFENETELSINVRNMGNVIVSEEFDFLLGDGEKNYTLTMMVPEEEGEYSYALNVDNESNNSTRLASHAFTVETIEPDEPEEPDTPPDVQPPDANETDTDGSGTGEPEEPSNERGLLGLAVAVAVIAGAGYLYMRNRS